MYVNKMMITDYLAVYWAISLASILTSETETSAGPRQDEWPTVTSNEETNPETLRHMSPSLGANENGSEDHINLMLQFHWKTYIVTLYTNINQL